MTKRRDAKFGMNVSRKKIIVILSLAVMILGYSFYDFAAKNTIKEAPPSVAGEVGNTAKLQEEPVVYVSGAVNKPGVFKLPPESRVLDAVNVAGGFTARADSEKINLAQPVKDGQQINVPSKIKPSATPSQPEESAAAKLININTASEKELQELPGIGPAMAKRIIDYRTNNGPFGEISELRRISGIGETRFNNLKSKVTL